MSCSSSQPLRKRFVAIATYVAVLISLFLLLATPVRAAQNTLPSLIEGYWSVADQPAVTITALPLTGGQFVFNGSFQVAEAGDYVIDFKNTSTFAMFKHTVLDAGNAVVAEFKGGIGSEAINPFMLRHGRRVYLEPGTYTLVTSLKTPYLIAQPQVYVDSELDYEQGIKLGNFIALICLGVLFGLMSYYIVLGLIRRKMVHGMYALFVLGNLLFQGTSLLVFSDVFGIHWFYWGTLPVLFSNIAYVSFVQSLLDIRQQNHPRLYFFIQFVFVILLGFALWGMVAPSHMLEMARYGVGVFLSLGLVCSIYLSAQQHMTARYYLIAISVFAILGGLTITVQSFMSYTLYVEHLGLVAVTVEALLLSFVLGFNFNQLFKEKEQALAALIKSEAAVRLDKLTGLPNRIALDENIEQLPHHGSITILDLDRLKYYNDQFGHAYGDKLLCDFSRTLRSKLEGIATLHRLGGDEFAITSAQGDATLINRLLEQTVVHLQTNGFELVGVSAGTAFIHEHEGNSSVVMHMADMRMYENKRAKKRVHHE